MRPWPWSSWAACSAGGGGEHAERRARMPALRDMFGAHTDADARADFITGDGGGEEFLAAHAGAHFSD